MISRSHSSFFKICIALLCVAAFYGGVDVVLAADHGDAPNVAGDQAADLADLYFFLDPADNTQAVIIMTVRGFIVPGEAVNFAIFDEKIRYRLAIENTGDTIVDGTIDITFSARTADPGPTGKEILQIPKAQTATILLPTGGTFTAPVLNPSLAATPPAQTVTTDATSGVSFFAGEVDDPFFFDIPGFSRFVASVRNGSADPTLLARGRDTFAGYNILAIAFRLPVSLIKGSGNIIGLEALTQRATQVVKKGKGKIKHTGKFATVDRLGNPAVNVALVPFNRKNEYNGATPQDDAAGRFADDIVATLTALGTNATNIGILASVAVTNGDFLRLDTTIANTGSGGGDNSAASFPNGRRLKDDVIDILLSIITNGGITTGDNVDANDVALSSTFPFLAQSQQPFAPGVIDDNTRN
jgi:hypothetical protein